MLFDLSIIPLGRSTHLSGPLAEVVKEIDDSGLVYQLTPTSTCVEGDWDDVVSLVRQCHETARRSSPHVVTILKIEDDGKEHDKLATNVRHVEEKAGRALNSSVPESPELEAAGGAELNPVMD